MFIDEAGQSLVCKVREKKKRKRGWAELGVQGEREEEKGGGGRTSCLCDAVVGVLF